MSMRPNGKHTDYASKNREIFADDYDGLFLDILAYALLDEFKAQLDELESESALAVIDTLTVGDLALEEYTNEGLMDNYGPRIRIIEDDGYQEERREEYKISGNARLRCDVEALYAHEKPFPQKFDFEIGRMEFSESRDYCLSKFPGDETLLAVADFADSLNAMNWFYLLNRDIPVIKAHPEAWKAFLSLAMEENKRIAEKYSHIWEKVDDVKGVSQKPENPSAIQ